MKNINKLEECMYEVSFLSNARYVNDGMRERQERKFGGNDWPGLDDYCYRSTEVQ